MARSSSGARVRVVSSSSGARVRGLERSSPPVTIFEFHTNKLASATARTRHSRISSALPVLYLYVIVHLEGP